MKKLIFLILLFLFSSLYSQDKLILTSKEIPYADTSLVFLPSGYDGTTAYPLLFMLHGWSGNYNQWNEVTEGLQYYADKYNFIIVCPDGFYESWYIDSPVKPNSQFETFFLSSLLPRVFSQYKIDMDNIFITGLSMGGHGAITLLLKHPDIFKSAASTSGILDITAFPGSWNMQAVLGQFSAVPGNWEKNSAIFLLDKIKGMDKQILFDCGTEDFAYNVNRSFYEKCLTLKLKATFISQPGTHSRIYWKNSIDTHFRFFSRLLSKNRS